MRYLPDINVWLALSLDLHTHFPHARAWLSGVDAGSEVHFCRAAQQGLLRLITTELVARRYGIAPLTNQQAWGIFDGYMMDARIGYRDEPEGLMDVWRNLASLPSASPKLWMDAYLAAFAKAGDYRLVTTDKAFKQFKGLDPLMLGE